MTGTPASMHAETRRYPGSLTDGMPASVTSSTVWPGDHALDQVAGPRSFVVLVVRHDRSADGNLERSS